MPEKKKVKGTNESNQNFADFERKFINSSIITIILSLHGGSDLVFHHFNILYMFISQNLPVIVNYKISLGFILKSFKLIIIIIIYFFKKIHETKFDFLIFLGLKNGDNIR